MSEQARTNPEGEEPKLADQILAALQNPSSEHAVLYAGLAFALIVVAAGLYKVFAPKKEIMVSFDDVSSGGAKKGEAAKTLERRRAKTKRPEGEAAVVQKPASKSDEIDADAL